MHHHISRGGHCLHPTALHSHRHVRPRSPNEAPDVRETVRVVETGNLKKNKKMFQDIILRQMKVLTILTMRVPSDIISCRDVVGLDSSTPAHAPWAAASEEEAAAAAAPALVEGPARVRPLPWKAVYLGFSGST